MLKTWLIKIGEKTSCICFLWCRSSDCPGHVGVGVQHLLDFRFRGQCAYPNDEAGVLKGVGVRNQGVPSIAHILLLRVEHPQPESQAVEIIVVLVREVVSVQAPVDAKGPVHFREVANPGKVHIRPIRIIVRPCTVGNACHLCISHDVCK